MKILATFTSLLVATCTAAEEIEGFTEPFRTVKVAAPDSGVIASLAVREGQLTKAGEIIATIEHSVLLATLDVAKRAVDSRGRLDAATAELELRTNRLKTLERLSQAASATADEVLRAGIERRVAAANLQAAKDELDVRKLEYDRVVAQIEQRKIRAPFNGVVAKIEKQEGEFVSPVDPILLNVVQLNPLLAAFAIPAQTARPLQPGQKLPIRLAYVAEPIEGVIDFISPVTDAESGTVRVKLRIANAQYQYRSGDRCTLVLPDATRTEAAPKAEQPSKQ